MRYFFGVDIGGTSVKTALVTDTGEIKYKQKVDTHANRGFEDMAARLYDTLLHSCSQVSIDVSQVEGVGVGVPAFLDDNQSVIIEAVNLGWTNVPLKQHFSSVFGLPVVVENDANVASLGESWLGAGRDSANVLCATIGTGVGGGVVINGKLIRGVTGMAGEVGHLVVKRDGPLCNCGNRGCLETLASATAIVRRAKEFRELGRIPQETELAGAESVFRLASDGNAAAQEVVDEAADWLGYGLALAATVTNPGKIVVGGGVSYAGNVLLNPVRKAFAQFSLSRVNEGTDIVLAELGNDAGVIGAARLAIQSRQ
ncbi:ROK family protein [Alicyclobacillus sp. SO9]|uniref:ROK family protein n=1 Tax=Alicyclobacillus sp. SO9 TaxID=2665646 RepID=UPI0018E7400E|nr:ROK family glucokinase [Alicyclobacillus sp. SO9]QQE79467.1 ROK family glucokinase [Alicyclobacillus sp. SO9]